MGGCANAIRRSLGAIQGVDDIAVDIDNKTVTVTGQAASDPGPILSALDRAGFPATPVEGAANSGKPAETSSCSIPAAAQR